MKKLLLILGLSLLLAATVVSAQEWKNRLTEVQQCNQGTPMTIFPTHYIGTCAGLDPYDPKPGYLLTQSYLQSNNVLGSAYKIVQCGQNILTGKTPNEWGWITYRLDPCPAGWKDSTQFKGYSLKQQAPGTKEVFLCTNNQDPFRVYSLSTDPNCKSRAGYTRVTSLGFWPQSTDFVLQPPQQPPAPAEQQVCCLVTRTRDDGRITRESGVQKESQCDAYKTKTGYTIEKLASAKCDEEVCCESEGRRDRQQFRDCYKRNGVGANVSLAECKGAVPPPTQPPSVCSVTKADNDALLATLTELERERDSYAKKEVCCVIENDRGDRKVDRTTLEKCNKNLQEKGIKLNRLAPPDMCEAKVCCMLGTNAKTASFKECIQNKGAEVEGAKCQAPPAPACGNQIKETGEACETEKDCGTGMICANCQCAKINVAVSYTTSDLMRLTMCHPQGRTDRIYFDYGGNCAGGIVDPVEPTFYLLKYPRDEQGRGPANSAVTQTVTLCSSDAEQKLMIGEECPSGMTPIQYLGLSYTTRAEGTTQSYNCEGRKLLGDTWSYGIAASLSQNCRADTTYRTNFRNAGSLGFWPTP